MLLSVSMVRWVDPQTFLQAVQEKEGNFEGLCLLPALQTTIRYAEIPSIVPTMSSDKGNQSPHSKYNLKWFGPVDVVPQIAASWGVYWCNFCDLISIHSNSESKSAGISQKETTSRLATGFWVVVV